jgi:hypothetical protein
MFNFKTLADIFRAREHKEIPQEPEVKPEPKVVDSGAVKARTPRKKAK